MKKILLVWGWTWWHITPLVSIYKYFQDKNYEFVWIWENNSLEQKIARENNIKFYSIKAWKLRRYFSLQTIIEPFKIIVWIFQSIRILKEEKPDIIFSKWWFVSLPLAIAAKFLKIKLFLHESDSVPWLANRYVSKFADKIYIGFDEANKYFDSKKTQVIGQILNPDLFTNLVKNAEKSKKTNLLVIWWSQWSRRIFEYILNNIESLKDFEISIVLGSLNSEMKKLFNKFDNIKTYEFISQNELKQIYYNTDISITRSWATSLAELEVFNIKMIMIPLKESANNHQYFNALSYKKKWNIMIEENEIKKLNQELQKLIGFKKENKILNSTFALEKIKKDI